MENKTQKFLDSIDAVAGRKIPEEVFLRARYSLLDYICVTEAGAQFQKNRLKKYLDFAQPEQGNYTAIGMGKKVALKEAVFLNGLNGHALDYDDGTNTGIIHLGSPIFSVLLPLAQKYGCTFEEILRAAVIGYETSFTMAVSIQPLHKSMGYHATGTCGVLGVAMAVSYLLNFTEEERFNAFATACISATGMLKVLDDGSELKPYNVAKTALLGLISVQLARAGYKGHQDSLSGDRGYMKMMTGREDIEIKPPLMNGTYAISKTYTKPYAACRYCHPSIEAAIALREENRVTVEEVENILVKTYYWAVNKHDHTEIQGSASAKMSIPYGVAAGLIFGRAGLNEYDEKHVESDTVKALTKKVTVVADDELTNSFPAVTTAIVEIITKSGEKFVKRVDFPKGEPENPMTEAEFRERYEELSDYAGKDRESSEKIYAMVMNGSGSMNELIESL